MGNMFRQMETVGLEQLRSDIYTRSWSQDTLFWCSKYKGQQTKRQITVSGWDKAACLLLDSVSEGISVLMEKSETGCWKSNTVAMSAAQLGLFIKKKRKRDLREYRKIVMKSNIALKKMFHSTHYEHQTHFY